MTNPKPNFWLYASISLTIVLLASIFTGGFSFIKRFQAPEIADRVIRLVKDSVPSDQKVELSKASFGGGLYEIIFKVGDQEFTTYVAMNGKLFFPQAIDLSQAEEPKPQEIPKKDLSKALLFTMSFCPYGNQAEEAMGPVAELLDKKAQIEPHYVIYENYRGGGPDYCLDKGKYCSLHGIDELRQDVRELCVFKYQKEKFWDFIRAINAECSLENIEDCWEKVAQKQKLDTAQIKTCLKKEALTLLKAERELNQKYQVTSSPTLIINDTIYQGNRTPEDYKKAICSGFREPPAECEKTLGTENAPAPRGGCQ